MYDDINDIAPSGPRSNGLFTTAHTSADLNVGQYFFSSLPRPRTPTQQHGNQQHRQTLDAQFKTCPPKCDGALEIEQVVNGEKRYLALGHIGDRLHALVYTLRGDVVRVISLRKANPREVSRYEQTT